MGIDRYFERYYAKGPRRRPVRIEFCEADVLDAFDEWRRAVGIASEERLTAAATTREAESSEGPSRRHESLPAHLDRVIARLTTLRAGADRSLDDAIDAVIRELDSRRTEAKALRGEARRELLDRLRAIDGELWLRPNVSVMRQRLRSLAWKPARSWHPSRTVCRTARSRSRTAPPWRA